MRRCSKSDRKFSLDAYLKQLSDDISAFNERVGSVPERVEWVNTISKIRQALGEKVCMTEDDLQGLTIKMMFDPRGPEVLRKEALGIAKAFRAD